MKLSAVKKASSLFLAAVFLCGCSQDSDGLTPVTLNEVAHSIFYAPQYAAIELGYFEEEGIDLTLVNGKGADKVMTALIQETPTLGLWDQNPAFTSARKVQRTMPSILPSSLREPAISWYPELRILILAGIN